ncbi:MAG: hypothetical protein KKF50_02965 [Nanoarchaeota archaeon]|nr:hypothetical protein [Nanoarchaeota archaeon]
MGKIKYKIINHKRRPLCDYSETCKNLAYREVYPNLGEEDKEHYWCYLCKKHFLQEKNRLKGKLVYCSLD